MTKPNSMTEKKNKTALPLVDDCPECENGTKGNYDGRVLLGGRGIYTCPVCGTQWQNADEKPTAKGIPLR